MGKGTFCIKTFGCQMNEYDSACIADQLANEGFEQIGDLKSAMNRTATNISPHPNLLQSATTNWRDLRQGEKGCVTGQADVILFNTCSVRGHAVQKLYTQIGDTKQLSKKNPGLIVGVCGCVAEQEGQRLLDRFPWVRLVAGPEAVGRIGELVKKIANNKSRIVDVGVNIPSSLPPKSPYTTSFRSHRTSPIPHTFLRKVARGSSTEGRGSKDGLTGGVASVPPSPLGTKRGDCRQGPARHSVSAYVPVVRGCNNFCAYCVVPYLRGRETSRPAEEILQEIRALAENDCREVILLGQNVLSYESRPRSMVDSPQNIQSTERTTHNDFAGLLRRVNEIDGIKRIRFITSHPRDVNEELIDAMADLDKVCEYIHLAMQAGSDKILKAMRRRYTSEQYLQLISTLRKKIPGIAVSTDLIVGFPGETDEDFRETLDMVKKIRFDAAFMFKYSDRPGTKAEGMKGKVDEKEKTQRLNELIKFQQEIVLEKNMELIGKETEVLVEDAPPTQCSRLRQGSGGQAGGQVYKGRTRTDKVVEFSPSPISSPIKGEEVKVGDLVRVKIESASHWMLKGQQNKITSYAEEKHVVRERQSRVKGYE